MDFLGPCFGYLDPLTKEFLWRIDCHNTQEMPSKLANLRARCHETVRERRHVYVSGLVVQAVDLQDAILGDKSESEEENFPEMPRAGLNTRMRLMVPLRPHAPGNPLTTQQRGDDA